MAETTGPLTSVGPWTPLDPWRLSLLQETANRRFHGYAKWFVLRWIANVTKGGPPPGDFDDWIKDMKGDKE